MAAAAVWHRCSDCMNIRYILRIRTRGLTTTAVILGVLSLGMLAYSVYSEPEPVSVRCCSDHAAGLWLMVGRGKSGSKKKWNGGW
jgi:hypothetical protein